MANTTDSTQPDYQRPEVTATAPDLTLVADLLAGTRRMWDQSLVYIRKWADEQQAVYDIRRKCETVFEGLQRVLSAAVGMLFAADPTLDWGGAESQMADHWENLDAQGTTGSVLLKRFSDMGLRDGLGLILVDHPEPPRRNGKPVVVTQANAEAFNLRPRWALYARAAAINWYDEVVNNQRILTQLTLKESATTRSGLFGSQTVSRYRDLRLTPSTTDAGAIIYTAGWALWEERETTNGQTTYAIVGTGTFRNARGEPLDQLPVAIAYTGRTEALMQATIPLLGVAWANLAHWQISTDLRFGRMVAGIEQPVVKGELMPEPGPNNTTVPGRIKLGWMTAVHVSPESDFDWHGPKGTGLGTLVEGVKEKLEQIGQQGMSFLVSDTRAAETAEAKRLDAVSENSTLATAAQGIEDAWNEALRLHWWYLGGEDATAPTVTIHKEFAAEGMDPAMLTALVGSVANAGLPVRILVEAMQQGGLIGEEEDADAIEAEMMANAEAKAAEQQQRQADQLATLKAGSGAA